MSEQGAAGCPSSTQRACAGSQALPAACNYRQACPVLQKKNWPSFVNSGCCYACVHFCGGGSVVSGQMSRGRQLRLCLGLSLSRTSLAHAQRARHTFGSSDDDNEEDNNEKTRLHNKQLRHLLATSGDADETRTRHPRTRASPDVGTASPKLVE